MKITAYSFESDLHCPTCAKARFERPKAPTSVKVDANNVPLQAIDLDLNFVRRVLETDDRIATHCGTCREALQ